ncbi:MAG TPA: crossover junction endodeoxyribonuclease RuvC [Acidobacteriota bacterium]|jgi:crossover junction endodeoxyribonuclease RuvC
MIVLGVDPGSRITGYGVIRSNGQKHECLTYGCIRRASDHALPQALRNIYETLNAILDEYRPQAIAVESLFHALNAKSALILGQARGIVLLCAAVHDVSVHEYSPLEIKKAVAGYGRAEKSQLQEMAKLLLNLQRIPEPHDASDALAVAVCHVHHQGFKNRIARQAIKNQV